MRIFDTFSLFSSTYAACESGWTFDGVDSCWMVKKNNVNFEDAKSYCASEGATLGVPNTYIIDNVVRIFNIFYALKIPRTMTAISKIYFFLYLLL